MMISSTDEIIGQQKSGHLQLVRGGGGGRCKEGLTLTVTLTLTLTLTLTRYTPLYKDPSTVCEEQGLTFPVLGVVGLGRLMV